MRAFLFNRLNINMEIEKLRARAQHKLSLSANNAPFNKEQIRRVLAKTEPLIRRRCCTVNTFCGQVNQRVK